MEPCPLCGNEAVEKLDVPELMPRLDGPAMVIAKRCTDCGALLGRDKEVRE